jgi:ribosome maturation factor RimP
LDLVDVEYKRDRKNWVLRVYIDKSGGVNLSDCQKVSHLIGDRIEVENLIPNPYALEVSSPGLDRPLTGERDFLRNKGKKIEVFTHTLVDGKRQFAGTVSDFRDETVFLEEKGKQTAVPLNCISKAKRVIEI